MEIIFWQNMLAFHQAAHVRALARMGHDVVFVAEETVTDERRAMGWDVPDFGGARVVVTQDDERVRQLVLEAPAGAVHIIGGVRGYRIGRVALAHCLETSRRVGFLSESPDPRSLKGLGRRLLYTMQRIDYQGRIDFVMAMGQQGVSWFCQCGYPPDRVFPYGYFTDSRADRDGDAAGQDTTQAVELVFLGQCIPRKGVDLALRALSDLRHLDWRLTVLGDGPARRDLEQLAMRLGVLPRVRFISYLPNREAMQVLASADVLLLPSRFDGWGVVVNEALMSGVPAICSDRCGARDLLRDTWRGDVFEAGSVASLREALARWIARGKRSAELTRRIRDWSYRIEGDSAAHYLLSVLSHVYGAGFRPQPPWSG